MKRRTVVIDRLGCAIAGTGLIALGVSAAAWEHQELAVPPDRPLTLAWLPGAMAAGWWPFALAVAALVLLALGLSWLISHRPGQSVGSTAAPGSDAAGVVTVDLDSAAAAAAAELARQPHIVTASGTSLVDRGQRVIELDVVIDSTAAGLAASGSALDVVWRDLATAMDGVPVVIRFLLRAPRPTKGAARVT